MTMTIVKQKKKRKDYLEKIMLKQPVLNQIITSRLKTEDDQYNISIITSVLFKNRIAKRQTERDKNPVQSRNLLELPFISFKPIYPRSRTYLFQNKQLLGRSEQICHSLFNVPPIFLTKKPNDSQTNNFIETLQTRLIDFFHIWSFEQWAFSLVTLVIMYVYLGYWYNKKLSSLGGWISNRARIFMIIFDLFFNLIIGLVCMDYRETVFGAFMLRCPIAISPAIFIVEFVCVVLYQRKYTLPTDKTPKDKEEIKKESVNQEIKATHKTPSAVTKKNESFTNLENSKKLEEFRKLNQLSTSNVFDDPTFDCPIEAAKQQEMKFRLREIRTSVSLQPTLLWKLKAISWQLSRFRCILPEPKGAERAELKKIIEYRYNLTKKKQ